MGAHVTSPGEIQGVAIVVGCARGLASAKLKRISHGALIAKGRCHGVVYLFLCVWMPLTFVNMEEESFIAQDCGMPKRRSLSVTPCSYHHLVVLCFGAVRTLYSTATCFLRYVVQVHI